MDNPLERMDDRSRLRASDADRERVADVLGQALSTGQLTHDEYSERLDTLWRSKTMGELEVLTRDLQVDRAPSAAPRPHTPTGEADTMVAVFSGVSRKGPWRVRGRINSTAIFGGIELDMTDAVFETPYVEIKTFALCGGMEIKPPPGAEVRCEGVGIFGGYDVRGDSTIDPSAPVIVIKGVAIFGGVGGKPRKRAK